MPRRPDTVEVRELGTVHEILKLAAKQHPTARRATLAYWRKHSGFPKPLKTVGRRVELWDLGHVRAWLACRELNREEGVTARIVRPGVLEVREGPYVATCVIGHRGTLRPAPEIGVPGPSGPYKASKRRATAPTRAQ